MKRKIISLADQNKIFTLLEQSFVQQIKISEDESYTFGTIFNPKNNSYQLYIFFHYNSSKEEIIKIIKRLKLDGIPIHNPFIFKKKKWIRITIDPLKFREIQKTTSSVL